MKKYVYAGIIVLIAAVLIAANYSSIIKANDNETKTKFVQEGPEEKASCCSEEETESYSEESIYQLESTWVDQDGGTFHLSELKGKPVVLTMFFASCTYACPILVEDMKRIERQIPASKLKDYRFVLISIDPERDTPEKLKQFAQSKGLDENRWTLLRGKKDNIMELAALLGFKYKKEKDGQFSHSNLINILNDEGEVAYQHIGLNQDINIALNHLNNKEENL